jgi:hypothetical protein
VPQRVKKGRVILKLMVEEFVLNWIEMAEDPWLGSVSAMINIQVP